jgi:flavin-binding protein dodecin
MFKMVEVVGISPSGFSEAVKDGVDKVLESGEKVHFFQVLEQRGAVREGTLKEFQVIIRVATEFPEKS